MALRFSLLGTPVAIGADFVLAMLVLGSFWRSPEQLPGWLAVVTASVLLHELGHAAVLEASGVPGSIRLFSGGGLTMGMRLPSRRHVVLALAGPGVGLVFGLLVVLIAAAEPRLADEPVVRDLIWVNVGWSLFNLLPFPGLDGDQVVKELTILALGRPAMLPGRIAGVAVIASVCAALVVAGEPSWALTIVVVAVLTSVPLGRLSTLLGTGQTRKSPVDLIMLGRYEEAYAAAYEEMRSPRKRAAALLVASDALRLMTRYEESDRGYTQVLATEPANVHALRGRAVVRRRLGRSAEADADLETLLAAPRGLVSKVVALFDAERYEEALRLARAERPENAAEERLLVGLAALLEQLLGRTDDALRDVDRALRDFPGREDLHDLRAHVLCDLARFDEARDEAHAALGAAPRHPDLLQTLGIVERLAGRPAIAVDHLVAGAVAQPNAAAARAELAVCFVQLGRVDEADAALAELPAWSSAESVVAYARAAVLLAHGDDREAGTSLAAAVAVRPQLAVRARLDPVFAALASPVDARVGAGGVELDASPESFGEPLPQL